MFIFIIIPKNIVNKKNYGTDISHKYIKFVQDKINMKLYNQEIFAFSIIINI